MVSDPRLKKGGIQNRKPLTARVGRRSKLTPDVQKKICDAIRAGNYLVVAARYAGVSQFTVMNWLERGRRATSEKGADGPYYQFLQAVDEAEAQSEVAANLHWRSAMPKDWHAAERWLEKRYPERYAPNRDLNGPTGAFAGVNINIGAQGGGVNAAVSAQTPQSQQEMTLEALIEANPELLSATMPLFEAMDAIYAQNEAPSASPTPSEAPIARLSATNGRHESDEAIYDAEEAIWRVIEGKVSESGADDDE